MVEPAASDTTKPSPPFRRLRRFVLLAGTIGIVFGSIWVSWNHEANRRLQARLDAIAARGEPVRIEQLSRDEPLDEDDNAARTFNLAASLIDSANPTPRQSRFDFVDYPPFSRRWHRLMDRAIVADADALATARSARSQCEADWDTDAANPLWGLSRPYLGEMRNLANLLGDAALYAHLHGDDFEALERARDARHLSRVLAAQPVLVDHLVSIGIDALAMTQLQVVAPGLKIQSPSATAPAGERPATPQQVRELIAELLDERANDNFHRAVVMERLWVARSMEAMTGRLRVLRPMVLLDLERSLGQFDKILAAATQPTAPVGQALMRSIPRPAPPPAPSKSSGQSIVRMTQYASSILLPSFARAFEQDMRVRAERRMTAVSLAAQLYRHDHGRWPASLVELTPDYLPAVPSDPFTPDEKPLGYVVLRGALPDGGDRPLVYHTADGTDHFALYGTPPPSEPTYGWRPSVMDQFRDLSRWRPLPKTRPSGAASPSGTNSAEAGEDDADEADQPGDQP